MTTSTPIGWQGRAYNQATESENRIHSDEVARQYGFRGGLVPGVTVYAYLVQPAIAAWGLDWLQRGTATAVFRKPLYDDGRFDVTVAPQGTGSYEGEVHDEGGTVCATGSVSLRAPADDPPPPVRRGDPPVPPADARPEATRAEMEQLRERGLGSLQLEWRVPNEYDRYVRDLDPVPDLVRPDRDGFANPFFSLGLANAILAFNVRLGPWIHAQSDVRHHAAIPNGSRLVVEARISDLFERSGHEFVDLDVAVFLEPDTPALSAMHRAIYRLRQP